MGLIDRFRKSAPGIKEKAAGLAGEHGDKVDSGIDKAADLADKATKGKFSDRIDGAADKAKGAVDDLGDDQPGPGQPGEPGPR